jgi:hypothetical protein
MKYVTSPRTGQTVKTSSKGTFIVLMDEDPKLRIDHLEKRRVQIEQHPLFGKYKASVLTALNKRLKEIHENRKREGVSGRESFEASHAIFRSDEYIGSCLTREHKRVCRRLYELRRLTVLTVIVSRHSRRELAEAVARKRPFYYIGEAH